VSDEIARCMRCGNCQAVCPLYSVTLLEPTVARGKIRLAEATLRKELTPSRILVERFDTCLTCLACVAHCPSGVRVDRIVLAARTYLAEAVGLSPFKRLALEVLRRPTVLSTGSKLLALSQRLAFKRRPIGMSLRFPPASPARRVLPALPRVSFRKQSPRAYVAPAETTRVALFTGCLANYAYPTTAHAAVQVLQALGATVLVPKEQHCCGYPVLWSGSADLAAEMARSQVRVFAGMDVEAVITLCGTCGEAFAKHYPELLKGESMGSAAAALAERTHDIAKYVGTVRPLDRTLLGRLDLHFTYHQPCHLGRGLGVAREPLDILTAIPGARYSPLSEPEKCCGGSGSFSFTHYDLADRVRRAKIADIGGTGASLVATGCSACRIHLEEGLVQAGSSQRVVHTVEILAQSLTAAG
jgi:glycolate oxidase iron-sulfur subunit